MMAVLGYESGDADVLWLLRWSRRYFGSKQMYGGIWKRVHKTTPRIYEIVLSNMVVVG